MLKWNKKEVLKLLEGSDEPCRNFYIASANPTTYGDFGPISDVMGVKYFDDWLNGNFDDLLLLNKAGVMTPETSTLSMIDKAKSRFEEEILKRIASVAQPLQQQQQGQGQ
jgi:hypothetical protein